MATTIKIKGNTQKRNCAHCGAMQDVSKAVQHNLAAYCLNCKHRLLVPKDDCDCKACRQAKAPALTGTIAALLFAFLFTFSGSVHAQTITGRVVGVADGDTLTVLDSANAQHKIRLAGIDAPESGQPFGQASKRNLSDLVFSKTVRVEGGKTDRYGRTVGLVSIGATDVNLEQLRAGLAWFYRQYANELDPARRKSYDEAEREARAGKRGLWRDTNPQAPWDYRHPDASGAAEKSPARNNGRIIGNRNSMIYHRPDCPDYEKVSERNQVFFKTEQEAEKAGFRRARNCP